MKIGLCGTMSVGKTTLVNKLKELKQFENYEFATERSKYLNDLGIPLNTDSTLKGQTIFLAERCAELIKENIITDRTVIDVMAFTNLANLTILSCSLEEGIPSVNSPASISLNKALAPGQISKCLVAYPYTFSSPCPSLNDSSLTTLSLQFCKLKLSMTLYLL